MEKTSLIVSNKVARRDFHISDTYEAGLVLKGTEIKSIRSGHVDIKNSFVRIEKGEAFLYGCDIKPWGTAGDWIQHESKRPRKILLHRKELLKIAQLVDQKGYTIPCLKLYWKGSKVKAEIGTAKGKDHADKRHDLKAKTQKREIAKEMARFNRNS